MAKVDYALVAEITAFLYREARLLDENRLAEWLDLLADDVHYYGPTLERIQGGPVEPRRSAEGLSFDLFNDDKPALKMRVDRVLSGVAYSDLPLSVTQHMVSNVEVEASDTPGEFVVRSKFLVLQARPGRHEGHESVFLGHRVDRIRHVGDDWRIAARELHLAHDVLPRAVSIIF